MRRLGKTWKPSPLPLEFHLTLDEGRWEQALQLYQSHPYSAPPVDTYELLKAILHTTGASVDQAKIRSGRKLQAASAAARDPEEIGWTDFWCAVNNGDSRLVSMALVGAKITGIQNQIGVAECCAILLQASGERWFNDLVEQAPYSTVTKNNLLTIAWEQSRWDVACDMLNYVRIGKGEFLNLWPLVNTRQWDVALNFVARCPKTAVPFDAVIPSLLHSGCSLEVLSHHLERAKILRDVDVVAPLLCYASQKADWAFVSRAMAHLKDIDALAPSALKLFDHLCQKHGRKAVHEALEFAGVPLHEISVGAMEDVGLTLMRKR